MSRRENDRQPDSVRAGTPLFALCQLARGRTLSDQSEKSSTIARGAKAILKELPSRGLLLVGVLALLFTTTGCGTLGEYLSGNTAERNALKMENVNNADDRREGMLFLVDHSYGMKAPYTTRYQQIAAGDPDPMVRATAIRSLNRSRDKSATAVFIKGLSDQSPLVRLEAAKALYRVPDDAAVVKLLAAATASEENKDVRIAAAEALQHYKRLDVARQLVSLLNQRDFAIAWQARRTLERLTGKHFNYDEAAWLDYIAGPSKPLG